MTNEEIIAECEKITEVFASYTHEKTLIEILNKALDKARAEGFKEAEKLHCDVSNVVQEANDIVEARIVAKAKEAGRQSVLNSNTLTKKAYEDAAIVAQKEINDLKQHIHELNVLHNEQSMSNVKIQQAYSKALIEERAEKQEQVRKLLFGFKSISQERNITFRKFVYEIFPDCAEQPSAKK